MYMCRCVCVACFVFYAYPLLSLSSPPPSHQLLRLPCTVTCAERHAFQRLIRGPFISDLSHEEEKRIHGVPDNVKHAILALPHAFAPRFDAAIHLRTQFQSFENQASLNSTGMYMHMHTCVMYVCVYVMHELTLSLMQSQKRKYPTGLAPKRAKMFSLT